MKNPLAGLIPIRLAFSVGSMRVFAISMFDDEGDEDDELAVVSNKTTMFGFAAEPADEVDPRLEPLEDRWQPRGRPTRM